MTAPPPGTRYVALGSSFAAGPGIPPLDDRGAMRSARNYPHQLAAALDLRLVDVTCSGATTADLRHRRQPTLTGARPPQVEAVDAGTGLVTITAGGNDVGYLGMLTSAALRGAVAARLPAAVADRVRYEIEAPAPERFAEVTAALVALVAEIHAVAPAARVVLVDYLTVLGTHADPSTVPLTAAQIASGRTAAARLADAFVSASAASGAELVVVSGPSADHGVGAPDPWMGGVELGVPWLGGAVPFHPTLAGMTAVAGALATLLSARP